MNYYFSNGVRAFGLESKIKHCHELSIIWLAGAFWIVYCLFCLNYEENVMPRTGFLINPVFFYLFIFNLDIILLEKNPIFISEKGLVACEYNSCGVESRIVFLLSSLKQKKKKKRLYFCLCWNYSFSWQDMLTEIVLTGNYPSKKSMFSNKHPFLGTWKHSE